MNETRTASPDGDEDWEIVPLWDPLLRPGPILVLLCMIGSWILFAASTDVVQAQVGRGTGLYGVLFGDPDGAEAYDGALAATCHWIGSLTIMALYWFDRPRRVRSLAADLEVVPGGQWIRARMAFPALSFARFCVVVVCCAFFVVFLDARYGEIGGVFLFPVVNLLPLTVLFAVTRARTVNCIDPQFAIVLIASAAALPSFPLVSCALFLFSNALWLTGLVVVCRWWWNVVPFP
jgi:hypothetical protein